MKLNHSISSSSIDFMRETLPYLVDLESLSGPAKLMDINLKDKIMRCFTGLDGNGTVKIYVESRSLAGHLQELLSAKAI